MINGTSVAIETEFEVQMNSVDNAEKRRQGKKKRNSEVDWEKIGFVISASNTFLWANLNL